MDDRVGEHQFGWGRRRWRCPNCFREPDIDKRITVSGLRTSCDLCGKAYDESFVQEGSWSTLQLIDLDADGRPELVEARVALTVLEIVEFLLRPCTVV